MKIDQYGIKRVGSIKGITIHNTSSDKSARELYEWLMNECKTSQGCHYLVDDSEVIQVLPLDYSCWHTGNAYDFGNLYTIAIEICSNPDREKYLNGEERAIELIKELMNEYDLTTDDIYFHCDFLKHYNCPANILNIYTNKKNFINFYFGGK